MNSQDWMDNESARNQAIAQLAEICAAMGLSWTAGDRKFSIELPDVISIKATAEVTYMPTVKKTFDISTWGPVGPVEGEGDIHTWHAGDDHIDQHHEPDILPDDFQMPEYGEKLEEGEPPKGDTDAEA